MPTKMQNRRSSTRILSDRTDRDFEMAQNWTIVPTFTTKQIWTILQPSDKLSPVCTDCQMCERIAVNNSLITRLSQLWLYGLFLVIGCSSSFELSLSISHCKHCVTISDSFPYLFSLSTDPWDSTVSFSSYVRIPQPGFLKVCFDPPRNSSRCPMAAPGTR